jgi:ribonuclease E
MSKRMLIDGTHPEEVRVVVTDGTRLEEYDIEHSTKKQLKGNIYLAKVTRVEPSLQAAFVDYGGNRHGFLAFSEIHPDYYQIPIADREALMADQEGIEASERAAQARLDEIDGGVNDDDDPDVSDADVPDTDAPDSDAGDGDEEGVESVDAEAADAEVESSDENADQPADEDDSDTQAASEDESSDDTDGDSEDAAATDSTDPAVEGEEVSADADAEAAPEADADAGSDKTAKKPREQTARRSRRPHHRYRIQEVIKRRQIILVQVVKEERGNKGAALTTYISLAGRYCVLMPNTARGGGISRKITNANSRRTLKGILNALDIQEGMGVIMRTAGMERNRSEIKRDYEYLVRSWDEIRELTLKSSAPALVYEEANLIKRAIRDLYSRETEEILVDGTEAYQTAKKFMRLLMPSHAKRVQPYRDPKIPLFFRYQIEGQLDAMYSPVVQLKSGGYLVMNSTEALVAIDVNSGRSTRERSIEETATKTNLEAADEAARQLRLRDLAGLVVIDFIDMDENRNVRAVEKRMKEAMKVDRARIQIGRISNFGLMELSRQRLRPSLLEGSTEVCVHCEGTGVTRSTESMAMHVLRAIEEEGGRDRSSAVTVAVATSVALYVLNQKRAALNDIEQRHGFTVSIEADDSLIPPNLRLDRVKGRSVEAAVDDGPAIRMDRVVEDEIADAADADAATESADAGSNDNEAPAEREEGARRKPRRRRRSRKTAESADASTASADGDTAAEGETPAEDEVAAEADKTGEETPAGDGEEQPKRRRRGRRGGRGRSRRGASTDDAAAGEASAEAAPTDQAAETPTEAGDGPQPDIESWQESGTVEAPVVEEPEATTEIVEAAEAPAEPDLSEPAPEPEAEPEREAASEPEPEPEPELVAQSEGNGEQPALAAVDMEETVAEVSAPAADEGPKRKGWWNRLTN